MLDPWIALGVASSIAQLIDFGVNIVRLTREIQDEGSPAAISSLERVTSDLISLSQSIKPRPPPSSNSVEELTKEEKVRHFPESLAVNLTVWFQNTAWMHPLILSLSSHQYSATLILTELYLGI